MVWDSGKSKKECEISPTESTTVDDVMEIASAKESDLSKGVEEKDQVKWVGAAKGQVLAYKDKRVAGISQNRQHSQLKGSWGVCDKNHTGICKYKKYKCRGCNEMGHLQVVCRNSRISEHVLQAESEVVSDESNWSLILI